MVSQLLDRGLSVSSMIIHIVSCYSPFDSRLVAWFQCKSLCTQNHLSSPVGGVGTTADGPTLPEATDIEQPAPQDVMAFESAIVGDDAQNQIPLQDFSSVSHGHVIPYQCRLIQVRHLIVERSTDPMRATQHPSGSDNNRDLIGPLVDLSSPLANTRYCCASFLSVIMTYRLSSGTPSRCRPPSVHLRCLTLLATPRRRE